MKSAAPGGKAVTDFVSINCDQMPSLWVSPDVYPTRLNVASDRANGRPWARNIVASAATENGGRSAARQEPKRGRRERPVLGRTGWSAAQPWMAEREGVVFAKRSNRANGRP